MRIGDPASEILQLAWEAEADLIVMSTHARRGAERALLGSVADQVLHSAGTPVVLLHPDGRAIERIETILVPLDGTPEAALALASAVPVAQSTNAKLVLVQASDQAAQQTAERHIEGVAAQLRATGVRSEGRCTGGKPAAAILSAAEEVDADIIVMSTHGRGGVVRSVLECGGRGRATVAPTCAPCPTSNGRSAYSGLVGRRTAHGRDHDTVKTGLIIVAAL